MKKYTIELIKLVKEKQIQINGIREEEKRREEKNRTSRNNIR